jgi:anti-sigma B factor antagonist
MPDAPRPFSLASSRSNDQAVLSVSGEIDIATVGEFAAAAREQLAAGPLLLDLRGVSFMDSSGLRALIGLMRDCEQDGWSLTIGRELDRNVKQLFEITGMLSALPLQDLGSAP